MTIRVEVDLAAAIPPYEQIRLQVLAHIAAGRLRAGDRLPTIRDLATDLGVASGTVQRAYRELEQTGAVLTRRRTGTVVGGAHAHPDADVRQAAHRLVDTARAAGLTDDAVLDLVRGALLPDWEHPARDDSPATPVPAAVVGQSSTPTSTGSGSSTTPNASATPSRT